MLDDIKRLFGSTLTKYNLKVTEHCNYKPSQALAFTCCNSNYLYYVVLKEDKFIFTGNYNEVKSFLSNFQAVILM